MRGKPIEWVRGTASERDNECEGQRVRRKREGKTANHAANV